MEKIEFKKGEKMKTAVIVYHSKTGTTKKYAEEIGKYLKSKGLDTQVTSIQAYSEDMLNNVDYVLFGCWTNGLMVILQHPDQSFLVQYFQEFKHL